MSVVVFTFDASAFARLGNMYAAAGKKGPVAMNRALKHVGDKARTGMRRALAGQTGLRYGVMTRAVHGRMQGGSYVISSRGGEVRLKFFSPREGAGGVTHRSPRRPSPIRGAFMRGGAPGHRVRLRMGGVFMRTGAGRLPIAAVKSGVWIPKEMVTGASAEAFFDTARKELPDRLAHELMRILGA